MPDYMVEMLVGEKAEALPPTYDGTYLEVAIEEVTVAKNVPGSVVMDVYETLPDTHYQIGGPNPSADPSVLVWYEIV